MRKSDSKVVTTSGGKTALSAYIAKTYYKKTYTYEGTTFYVYYKDNDRTTFANGTLFAEKDGWDAINEWKLQFANKRYRVAGKIIRVYTQSGKCTSDDKKTVFCDDCGLSGCKKILIPYYSYKINDQYFNMYYSGKCTTKEGILIKETGCTKSDAMAWYKDNFYYSRTYNGVKYNIYYNGKVAVDETGDIILKTGGNSALIEYIQ